MRQKHQKQTATGNYSEIVDVLYEAGFYSVFGCFTVEKEQFSYLLEYSIRNNVNAFDQFAFISSLDSDIFDSNHDVLPSDEYINTLKGYIDGEYAYVPTDDFAQELVSFYEMLSFRKETHNGYESRRKKANAFLANNKNRERLFTILGNKCNSCGSTEHLSLDHITAVANGGGNDDENFQVLCRSCNSSKGAK